MATDISSMFLVKTAGTATNSGQVIKPETSKALVDANNGLKLPEQGKDLPLQSNQQPANTQPVKVSEVSDAVSQINGYVQNVQRDLSFSMDEESGRTIIKVIDSASGELIRQIPTEEVLALANHIQAVKEDTSGNANDLQGILFSEIT